MGDIGPERVRYEVLPGSPDGFAEADRWTLPIPARARAGRAPAGPDEPESRPRPADAD